MVSSGDTDTQYLLENTSSALTSPETCAVALSCTRTLASATGQTPLSAAGSSYQACLAEERSITHSFQ